MAALAAAVVLTACADAPGTSASTPDGTPTASARASAPAASPTDFPTTAEAIAALWQAVHDERLAQAHAETPPDSDAFVGLATEQATEALVDLIRAARSDVPIEVTESEFWPEIEIAASGDEASVEDCVLVATRASEGEADVTVRSQVWTGSAIATEDGWRLHSISPGQDHCVAPDLNEQLLDAYAAYHRAWTTAWDPPNPNHPLLAETMTGQRLEEIRQQLQADREEGIAFRDPHDPRKNAVVLELGIGTATVSDCHPAHHDYGAYDVETDERRDDVIPSPQPGELHLTSVDLVRTDERTWKVESSALLTDSNCSPRGTSYVVAP